MSGAGARARKQAAHLKQRAAVQSIFAENVDPKRAFKFVERRISWLNEKIALAQDQHRHWFHYLEEREALIWMLDTIKELSRRLLERDDEGKAA